MLLLALDTSSQAATAAIICDGTLLCETTLNHKKTHSVKMLPAILTMLENVELTLSDMDVFACGVGPGSFTGVRIGVAMTKGFAQSLDKKIVALNSLEILANNIASFDGLIIPMFFARVDEIFCAIYRQGESLQEVLAPAVWTIDQLLAQLEGEKCIFLGDGSLHHQDLIKERLGEDAHFEKTHNQIIRGGSGVELAYQKAMKKEFVPYYELQPAYLRPSQAEREFGG